METQELRERLDKLDTQHALIWQRITEIARKMGIVIIEEEAEKEEKPKNTIKTSKRKEIKD